GLVAHSVGIAGKNAKPWKISKGLNHNACSNRSVTSDKIVVVFIQKSALSLYYDAIDNQKEGPSMREIVVSVWMTLDGVFDADIMDQWFNPYHSDDRAEYIKETIVASDALLLGRKTRPLRLSEGRARPAYRASSVPWPAQRG